MSDQDFLSPQEASYIAHNAYFTLKDWISGQPTIGMETLGNVHKMVIGDGLGTVAKAGGSNISLRGTDRRHVVVATRGTRAEHSRAGTQRRPLPVGRDADAAVTPLRDGFAP